LSMRMRSVSDEDMVVSVLMMLGWVARETVGDEWSFGLERPGPWSGPCCWHCKAVYAGLGLISAIVEMCRSNLGTFG
jgi:hypothetical protein